MIYKLWSNTYKHARANTHVGKMGQVTSSNNLEIFFSGKASMHYQW